MASEIVAVLPGNISGHHDGRAEFAERAGKREQHSADNATRRQRDGNGEEHAPATRSQCAGDLFQARIDLGKRHARRTDQERHRHHAQCQQYGAPGKNDVEIEVVVHKSADGAAPSENFQQNQSHCHRRHNERQRDEGFHERFARPITPGQHPGERQAERQNDQLCSAQPPTR